MPIRGLIGDFSLCLLIYCLPLDAVTSEISWQQFCHLAWL